jgi:polysaccharide pyruvyl transferase WcaK-like protein
VIANVRDLYPSADFLGISLDPTDTTARHEIPAVSLGRTAHAQAPPGYGFGLGTFGTWLEESRNPAARLLRKVVFRPLLEPWLIWRTVLTVGTLDCLVISGGGQLDDSYGGAKAHPYSLFRWMVAAKARRVPVAVLSVGAAPLRSRFSRALVRCALHAADYHRVARECDTDRVVPDMAFGLPVPPARECSGSLSAERSRVVLELAPVGDSTWWPSRDELAFLKSVRHACAVVSALVARGWTVSLVPGDIQPDTYYAETILESLDANTRTKVFVPTVVSVAQLVSSSRPGTTA